MTSPSDSTKDSVKTCPEGYSRALQRQPNSMAYLNRKGEAQSYEKKRWQSFLEKSKQESCCIGCRTVNIELGCPKRYLAFTDAWTKLLDDILIIKKVAEISTRDAHCWRLSATLRDSYWLEDLNTKHAVGSV